LHRCSTAIWFPLLYAHLLIFGRDKEHRLGPRPQTPSTCRPLAEGNGEPVPLLEDCPSLAYHHAITSIHTSRSANLLTTTCTPTRLSPEPRQVEDRAAVQAPSCPDKASGKGRNRAATLCAFFGGRHRTTSLGTRTQCQVASKTYYSRPNNTITTFLTPLCSLGSAIDLRRILDTLPKRTYSGRRSTISSRCTSKLKLVI
jgi:hypothetical protein